jgi:ATP-dependent helicase/nuclease subunit A
MTPVFSKIRDYADHMRNLRHRLPNRWKNDKLIPFYREFPYGLAVFNTENPRDMYELLSLCSKKLTLVQKEWTAENTFTAEECKQEKAKWDDFRERVIIPALEQFHISRYGLVIRILKKARALYDEQRRLRGKLNFQDLLMKAASLLRDHPNVRIYFRKKYTHLLIDEFQDTDPVQAQVMMFLTSKNDTEPDWRKCFPAPGSLFVVGDPKQSIYRFRRADIVTYNEVKQMICGPTDGKNKGILVKLYANFRSTAPVREWINSTFKYFFPSSETPQSPVYVPLDRGREFSRDDTLGALYKITVPGEFCKKNREAVQYEAARISSYIRYMLDHPDKSTAGPLLPSDFMIITRVKKNLHIYANALEENGIPYAITGSTTLNDIRELRLLYLCLKTILNPDDQTALAGTLRSELFGFSDAMLYEYSLKGGQFSFIEQVPDTLEDKTKLLFTETFEKLKQFRQYFRQIPAVSALEKMISDLGLLPLACLGSGGHLKAGGLVKCIELIRTLRTELWSPSEIVHFLNILIDREISYDSLSVSGDKGNVVRVMNLHQAKGLEARVVFLADPGGKRKHEPDLHIVREAAGIPGKNQTKGYMLIQKKINFNNEPIAHPEQWEEQRKNEQEFLINEDTRLYYVAATRAKQVLVVVQKQSNETKNFWVNFKAALSPVPELPDYGPQPAPVYHTCGIAPEDIHDAGETIESNIVLSMSRTYQVKKAKEYALHEYPGHLLQFHAETAGPGGMAPAAEDARESGEYGTEWGELIHRLLEVKMKDNTLDLSSLADSLINEYELEPGLKERALLLVESVMQSDIWKRALKSSRVFTEIPFQILLDEKYKPGLPTIVRGVIDLIFYENHGWVLVDYKTDKIENNKVFNRLITVYTPQLLLYADAWKRITGEKVKEAGLYFTRVDTYRAVM